MNVEHLTRMANQIGTFYDAMPDREQAKADIVSHLQRFWEPRMRRALLQDVDARAGAGLSPMLAEAIRRHRPSLG